MTTRAIFTTITLHRPFRLTGSDMERPAGNYEIETDEELIEGALFLSYRRVSTSISLNRQKSLPDICEMMTIDPIELDAIIAADRNMEREYGSLEPDALASQS